MLDPAAGPFAADEGEAGVGTLVHRLVNEGKALAQAEVEPYKAKANERLAAYKRAGIFFGIAGVLALSAVVALMVGLELTLAPLVGPGGATAIVVLVTLALAGMLALVGKRALAPADVRHAPDPAREIARAEHDKDAARRRVGRTLAALQDRLSPRQIARRAARDATEKGNAAVETAKRNPGTAAGVAAVAGLFLARHRIAALFRRSHTETSDTDAS